MSVIKQVTSPVFKQIKQFDSWFWLQLEIILAPVVIKMLSKFIKWLDKRIAKSDKKKKRKAQIEAVKEMSGLL